MKVLFQTKRLTIRELIQSDIDGFFDMQSNKEAMDMVPDKVMSMDECIRDLKIRINNYSQDKKPFDVWAVIDKKSKDFVGTCAMVYEIPKGVEIGYRFRVRYWGNGIGSEVTEGLIKYIFEETNEDIIVADVSKFNIGSTKILEKFMTLVGESFNEKDNCQDLHFELRKRTNYDNSLLKY